MHIISYSPLHNVDPSKKPFPPTMLLTADHDDRELAILARLYRLL
jgi:prolyl oligopeptidase